MRLNATCVHAYIQTTPIPPCPAILIERICAPIRDYGLPVLTAVTLVGINPDLWPALCPRGSELAFAVRKAEAQFMRMLLKLIFGPSIPGQSVNKAQIRAILERRFPHEWGRLKGGAPPKPDPDAAQNDFDPQQSEKRFEWPVVEDEPLAAEEDPFPSEGESVARDAMPHGANPPPSCGPRGRVDTHHPRHTGVCSGAG